MCASRDRSSGRRQQPPERSRVPAPLQVSHCHRQPPPHVATCAPGRVAGRQQRLLDAAGRRAGNPQSPTLDPDQAARPPDRGQKPRIVSLISRLPRTRPVPSSTAASVCVPVRPDHDHVLRPFVWLAPNEADLRRTTVTRGESHASINSRRWSSDGGGRHKLCRSGQSSRRRSRESARHQAREPTRRVGRHRPDPRNDDSDRSRLAAARVELSRRQRTTPHVGSRNADVTRRNWRWLSRRPHRLWGWRQTEAGDDPFVLTLGRHPRRFTVRRLPPSDLSDGLFVRHDLTILPRDHECEPCHGAPSADVRCLLSKRSVWAAAGSRSKQPSPRGRGRCRFRR